MKARQPVSPNSRPASVHLTLVAGRRQRDPQPPHQRDDFELADSTAVFSAEWRRRPDSGPVPLLAKVSVRRQALRHRHGSPLSITAAGWHASLRPPTFSRWKRHAVGEVASALTALLFTVPIQRYSGSGEQAAAATRAFGVGSRWQQHSLCMRISAVAASRPRCVAGWEKTAEANEAKPTPAHGGALGLRGPEGRFALRQQGAPMLEVTWPAARAVALERRGRASCPWG